MRLVVYLLFCAPCLFPEQLFADGKVPMDASRWEVRANEHAFEQHLGRPALYLENGVAILSGAEFSEGSLEFDIAFDTRRGFSGVEFHMEDEANYEHFYLRPHQSGKPDATQYQPVFNGHAGWQIYYGKEFAAGIAHSFDQWQRVRIEVSGGRADIYVDSEEPVLRVPKLLLEGPGKGLALSSSFAPAWFSNVFVHPTHGISLDPVEASAEAYPTDVISPWSISTAFEESSLRGAFDLSELAPHARMLDAGYRGIANIGRTVEAGGPNTVVARAQIHSDSAGSVALDFGFSDRAQVFLNGTPLFRGNRKYMSQDYRFLGTVGLHDTLLLPLRQGTNELAIAVSEDFGGWAITARLEPADGVRILERD